jgi:6,7-dimethyl-8-ribityllumazine synthase
MYTPHVVVIEGRDDAEISDVLYQKAVQELEEHHIEHTRLSVASALAIPTAFRLAIEATKNGSFGGTGGIHTRRPEGYIVLGHILRQDRPEAERIFQEAYRAIQELSTYYALPFGYGIVVCDQGQDVVNFIDIAQKAVISCLSLITLKQQLGLMPNAVLPL